MGHRAIICYKKPNGLMNLHYSHWGAHGLELIGRISEETPLGGDDDMAPPMLEAFVDTLAEEFDADVEGYLADAGEDGEIPERAVDPRPLATDVTIYDAFDELDNAAYESLYVVDTESWRTRGFHVEQDLTGEYLLVESDEAKSLRDSGWFRGVKSTIQSFVEDDVLDEATANERLLSAVFEKYADRLGLQVLARSPAVRPEHFDEWPDAFIRFKSRTNVLGQMYPDKIQPHADWELPTEFPDIKTAKGKRVSLP